MTTSPCVCPDSPSDWRPEARAQALLWAHLPRPGQQWAPKRCLLNQCMILIHHLSEASLGLNLPKVIQNHSARDGTGTRLPVGTWADFTPSISFSPDTSGVSIIVLYLKRGKRRLRKMKSWAQSHKASEGLSPALTEVPWLGGYLAAPEGSVICQRSHNCASDPV